MKLRRLLKPRKTKIKPEIQRTSEMSLVSLFSEKTGRKMRWTDEWWKHTSNSYLIALSFSSTDSQGWRSSLNSRSSRKETIEHFKSLKHDAFNRQKLILASSWTKDLLLEIRWDKDVVLSHVYAFLSWVPQAFNPRFRRALIPANANANVKNAAWKSKDLSILVSIQSFPVLNHHPVVQFSIF